MNTIKITILGFFTFILAGCASSGWELQDSSPVPSDQLKAAKVACKVEDKLYNFRYTKITYDAATRSVSDPEAKTQLKEQFQAKKQKLDAEIDECMDNQGLKRKN